MPVCCCHGSARPPTHPCIVTYTSLPPPYTSLHCFSGACLAALILFRHIVFTQANKASVLGRPPLIDAVMALTGLGKGVSSVSSHARVHHRWPPWPPIVVARVEATAASAIWTLCYQSQKAIHTVRQRSNRTNLVALLAAVSDEVGTRGEADRGYGEQGGQLEATERMRNQCMRGLVGILSSNPVAGETERRNEGRASRRSEMMPHCDSM